MRRAARLDASHRDVVLGLQQVGLDVLSLAAVGKGCPDLLVAWRGVNLLVEVKTPGAANRRRRKGRDAERLARQAAFRATWQGPAIEAESVDDVLRWFRERAEVT